MMKRIYLFIFGFLCFSITSAQSGDLTVVNAHQDVDLIWQGAPPFGKHDQLVSFPDNGKNYQNIEMQFTLGCATSGTCSHWDYDVDVFVGYSTGIWDSTIIGYDTLSYQPYIFDTISQNPLELDTIQVYIFEADTLWNAFEVVEWYELGRLITPYGNYMDWGQNGFDNAWTHTFKYDVTDFAQFLKGDQLVRVHFHGWQDGFRASVDFEFTEGNPTRDVVNVTNVYNGGNYTDFNQFDASFTPERNISLPANVEEAKLKVTITGHGQAGEFTPINYTVKSNGTTVRVEDLWRDDCGDLPLFPQGGTWVLNRTNWCPGDAVEIHEFELTDYIQGNGSNKTLNLDIDLQDYTPSAAANYSISAQLITYEAYRRDLDVELEEIVAPSMNENFVRFNPICDHPIVRIRNYGMRDLTSCEISYWVDHTNKYYYTWTGNLKNGEWADVELPNMNWTNTHLPAPEFFAEVNWPNNLPDQFVHNNLKNASFEIPVLFTTNSFQIRFRVNDHPEENSYTVTSSDGTVYMDESNFTASTFNNENIYLPDGCYVFEMKDFDVNWGGGDGLNWWYNTQNGYESAGYVELRNSQNNQILHSFQSDFGSTLRLPFLVNTNFEDITGNSSSFQATHPTTTPYTSPSGEEFLQVHDTIWISEDKIIISETAPVGISDELAIGYELSVYPNPTNGVVNILLQAEKKEVIEVKITNILGERVKQIQVRTNENQRVKMEDLSSGLYLFSFELNGKKIARKITLL